MRCGCPHCQHSYMIQTERGSNACVCADCGYRCNACMGTNTVLSPEQIKMRAEMLWLSDKDDDAPESEPHKSL